MRLSPHPFVTRGIEGIVDHMLAVMGGDVAAAAPAQRRGTTEDGMAKSDPGQAAGRRKRSLPRAFVRVELKASEHDAGLLGAMAAARADPDREAETRSALHARFGQRPAGGLKALLAAAPLDDIVLDRPRDAGRRHNQRES